MKTATAIMITLALAALFGCQMSRQGGGMAFAKGFRISVPYFNTHAKQGELQIVTISLQRESLFKQDVKLDITVAPGISVEPSRGTVKASDTPEVQLRITVPKDAALGKYAVVVTGTPETGEPTSVGFTVTVTAP